MYLSNLKLTTAPTAQFQEGFGVNSPRECTENIRRSVAQSEEGNTSDLRLQHQHLKRQVLQRWHKEVVRL